MKRINLLIVALVMTVTAANAEKVPYAVYDNGTLTFAYGEKPTSQFVFDVTNTFYYTEWWPIRTSVFKVVFESSFSEYRPKSCSGWFLEMTNLTNIFGIENLNTSDVTDMSYMFNQCSRLTSLDVSNFNTSNVTDMRYMFNQCSSLTNLDVSGFNTSKVTDMFRMFCFCEKLTSLNVSGFNTSNCTNMAYMFSGCSCLTTLDVSGFNTSKVTDMSFMFNKCSGLTSLDISGFNTSKVTDMRFMFSDCSRLTTLDVCGFNTSDVTNMQNMFNWCKSLTILDVSGFNTTKVTNMSSMFTMCSSLVNLDVRSFNTSNVSNMNSMFNECKELAIIYCNTAWNCTDSGNMFQNCYKLCGVECYSGYNDNDVTYANPETGYFTYKVDTFVIKVTDQSVTSMNCTDLSVTEGVTGTVTYDDATHSVTLANASISNESGDYGIYCDGTIDTLYVNVEGECNIISPNGTGIYTLAKCVKIQGGGTLNITANDGIRMMKASANRLWVTDGTQVYVDGTRYGVQGCEYTPRVVSGLTAKTYRYTALQVDGEKTLLSVKGTTKSYQTLGSFALSEGYKVTAPASTSFYTTDLNGEEQYTFCKCTLIKEKFTGTTTVTFTPIANAWVTIEDTRTYFIPGDANGDGSVTMSDANLVVNYYLATDKSSIEGFNYDNANVNGDEGITMSDANQIVNMYLGGQ